MTIEFTCPTCGRPMRAPDDAAGKKGQCAHCGGLAMIPVPAEPAPAGDEKQIEFACPQCGQPVCVPASAAGRKGRCPSCGAKMRIPHQVWSEPVMVAEAGPPTPRSPTGHLASGEPDVFFDRRCTGCGKTLRIPTSAIDRPMRCSHCGATVKSEAPPSVPATAAKPTAHAGASAKPKPTPKPKPQPQPTPKPRPAPAALGGLTPLPAATPGLTPLPAAGAGLTPLPPSTPGLTPLDGGLTPLGGGLTPLSPLDNGPLSALGPPAPVGGLGSWGGGSSGGGAVNPYQSPAAVTYTPRRAAKPPSEVVVVIPAVFLILVASGTLLWLVASAIFGTISGALIPGGFGEEQLAYGVGRILGLVIGGAINVAVISGALQMMRFQNYSAALTAAILYCLPCSFLCLGMPFGIWALIVLCLPSVRKRFD